MLKHFEPPHVEPEVGSRNEGFFGQSAKINRGSFVRDLQGPFVSPFLGLQRRASAHLSSLGEKTVAWATWRRWAPDGRRTSLMKR